MSDSRQGGDGLGAPIPAGEEIVHAIAHGLVLTDRALYVCRPVLGFFRRWQRIALQSLVALEVFGPAYQPSLRIRSEGAEQVFQMPHAGEQDAAAANRGELDAIVAAVRSLPNGMND